MRPSDSPTKTRVCPLCGKTYHSHPAISRIDNTTLICPDCGIREALASIGVEPSEQEKIIETVHNCTRDANI